MHYQLSHCAPPPPPPRPPTPPLEEPRSSSPEPEVAEPPVPVEPSPPPAPPSPVYQRKYFPNPEPSEPFRPAARDYSPNLVKIRRAEEPLSEAPALVKRQFSSEVEVRPVKFTASQENCVKKALFVGDAWQGGGDAKPEHCDTAGTGKPVRKKASEKIIEILTAKKMRDESSPAKSPALSRRRLSEYVSEKLLSSPAGPPSPVSSRKKY